MGDPQYVKFVSQKINKVRWRPTRSSLQKPDVFITGSWENKTNTINVWSVQGGDAIEDENLETDKLRCAHKCRVPGNIDSLTFADPDTVIAGLGNGDVVLLKYSVSQMLDIVQEWKGMHHISGNGIPCTGVDVSIPDFVTVGEDGNINLMRIGSDRLLRKLAKADSCPITDVCFVKQNEICTVNKMGQLRLWDLRSSQDSPSRIVVTSEELIALESVCRHPSRPHILAAGGADGCVTTFDIRKEVAPVTKLEVHDLEVWEVQFHPTSPDNLFTCSEDGAVRRLDITSELKNQDSLISAGNRPPVDVLELLNCHNMAVNSLSISGSRLVCGTDSESVYVIENIQ
ncbi:nucleoporin Nup43-like [Styela clava]